MAKCIMIQGTMSNVGKSLITAGLCRIFMQDGYKTAPFKAQNIALNSYITEEGYEMGRSQVMQAEAAGIKPSVRMNPILLKPTNDTDCQVIVNGEVWKQTSARAYFSCKKQLIPMVMEAYHSLEEEYDIIVIEGAGSPAEINLKAQDTVNMGMAKAAHAPVLMVGDVDRGGVFAQLYGTVQLLDEDEKDMVKGMIINKFRGDKTIFLPGIEKLEKIINLPAVGVVPYMTVDVDDEDSLSQRLSSGQADLIDIAVIQLPHISNFTDFNVFQGIQGVSLRYVRSLYELGIPDMIIIPGTKNTMRDLMWMRQNGLEGAVLRHAANSTVIFGVCGGYQMLGESISDPMRVEEGGSVEGMNLLPVSSVFQGQKTRTRVKGKFRSIGGRLHKLQGCILEGYEIHMGETKSSLDSITEITDCISGESKLDGCYRGNIYGSYVHGIFDAPEIAEKVVRSLAEAKGVKLEEMPRISLMDYKNQQYDLVADTLRKHLDMNKIYEILESGI